MLFKDTHSSLGTHRLSGGGEQFSSRFCFPPRDSDGGLGEDSSERNSSSRSREVPAKVINKMNLSGLAKYIEEHVPANTHIAFKLDSNQVTSNSNVCFSYPGHYDLEIAMKEVAVEGLISKFKEGRDVFLLVWNGSKVPRGAVVNSIPIDHTQNSVISSDGEIVGVYDRIIEFGGPNKKAQALILYLNPPQPKELPELLRSLPKGTERIISFDDLCARPEEFFAESYDQGKSWSYYRVPTEASIRNSKLYTGGKIHAVNLMDKVHVSSTFGKNSFYKDIFRTVTDNEKIQLLQFVADNPNRI